ncbi:MAG: hypothetical protein GY850_45440 [bacterium]|nr:hypothetical protein [bacterium]
MEKIIKLSVLAAVFSLFIVSGCAHYPGGLAPSTTPLEGKEYDILGPAKGQDNRVSLLGILPITGSNHTRNAVADALKSSGGDALINVTVESVIRYWILWSNHKTLVHGDAIKFR